MPRRPGRACLAVAAAVAVAEWLSRPTWGKINEKRERRDKRDKIQLLRNSHFSPCLLKLAPERKDSLRNIQNSRRALPSGQLVEFVWRPNELRIPVAACIIAGLLPAVCPAPQLQQLLGSPHHHKFSCQSGIQHSSRFEFQRATFSSDRAATKTITHSTWRAHTSGPPVCL